MRSMCCDAIDCLRTQYACASRHSRLTPKLRRSWSVAITDDESDAKSRATSGKTDLKGAMR